MEIHRYSVIFIWFLVQFFSIYSFVPSSVKISKYANIILAKRGTQVLMNCSNGPLFGLRPEWYLENLPVVNPLLIVTDSGAIHLPFVSHNSSGLYICRTYPTFKRTTRSLEYHHKLRVYDLPKNGSCKTGFEQQYGVCFSCLPGQFYNSTDNSCQRCSEGYYSDRFGSLRCLPCFRRSLNRRDSFISSEVCRAAPEDNAYITMTDLYFFLPGIGLIIIFFSGFAILKTYYDNKAVKKGDEESRLQSSETESTTTIASLPKSKRKATKSSKKETANKKKKSDKHKYSIVATDNSSESLTASKSAAKTESESDESRKIKSKKKVFDKRRGFRYIENEHSSLEELRKLKDSDKSKQDKTKKGKKAKQEKAQKEKSKSTQPKKELNKLNELKHPPNNKDNKDKGRKDRNFASKILPKNKKLLPKTSSESSSSSESTSSSETSSKASTTSVSTTRTHSTGVPHHHSMDDRNQSTMSDGSLRSPRSMPIDTDQSSYIAERRRIPITKVIPEMKHRNKGGGSPIKVMTKSTLKKQLGSLKHIPKNKPEKVEKANEIEILAEKFQENWKKNNQDAEKALLNESSNWNDYKKPKKKEIKKPKDEFPDDYRSRSKKESKKSRK